jgi:hypothetical protein
MHKAAQRAWAAEQVVLYYFTTTNLRFRSTLLPLTNLYADNSLSIDYTNPLTTESDSAGVCTMTVKVLSKDGTVHEIHFFFNACMFCLRVFPMT